jgi:alpha-N-arabinofuranosidase
VALTHLDPTRALRVVIDVAGAKFTRARGETLKASRVDSVNSFAAPRTVVPSPVSAQGGAGKLTLELPPASVTVVMLE